MTLTRILTSVAAAVVTVVATMGAIAPTVAEAKTGGGEVIYYERTGPADSTLLVCEDWGVSSCQAYHWFRIRFGESSKKYVQDADGFYIPSKCTARVGSTAYPPNQWIKVTDIARARVELSCWS